MLSQHGIDTQETVAPAGIGLNGGRRVSHQLLEHLCATLCYLQGAKRLVDAELLKSRAMEALSKAEQQVMKAADEARRWPEAVNLQPCQRIAFQEADGCESRSVIVKSDL